MNTSIIAYLSFVLMKWILIASAQDRKLSDNRTNIDANNSIECGRTPPNYRIARGSNTRPGQFPSFVSIAIKTGGNLDKIHTCGGTIIGARHIISAAHCFNFDDIAEVLITTNIFGVEYAMNLDPKSVYVVEKICLSGNFGNGIRDSNGFIRDVAVNDVSILLLKEPITFSETVQPACLPKKPLSGPGAVVGMGLIDYVNKARILKFTDAVTTTCPDPTTHKSILCIMRRSNAHGRACRGDSGGPFYLIDNERMVVYGGISFGPILCSADDMHVMLADYYYLRHEISLLIDECLVR